MDDKFSLENFKRWMSECKREVRLNQTSKLIGLLVESKINYKRIPRHVLAYEGDLKEIIEEFKDSGGRIIAVEDINFLIETDSGNFKIHRCYVRKKE